MQFFCVFLPPLLNLFCFCEALTISVLYHARFCKISPLISIIFLKLSLVFFIYCFPLFLCIFLLKKPISPCYSLELCVQLGICLSLSPLPFTSLPSSAICNILPDNHFAFLHFFVFGIALVTTSAPCYETLKIIAFQALCLLDLVP